MITTDDIKRAKKLEVALENTPKTASGSDSPELTGYANLAECLDDGWVIWATSCSCGANWAWLKDTGHGTKKMFGCVCHHTPTKDFA